MWEQGDKYMGEKTLLIYQQLLRQEGLFVIGKTEEASVIKINHLTCNSKEVSKGTLFLCKGAAFKEEYLREAISRGAVAYISEEEYGAGQNMPHIIVSSMRKAMPLLARAFTGNPDEALKLVGITGTKGKTTTTYYIKAILDEYLHRQKEQLAGILSSIHVYDGQECKESTLTTPEPVELFQYLKNAKEAGLTHLTMEISSQGLKYYRVRKLQFEVGVFLNIAEDHISPIEHEDFEDYFSAKLSLFKQTQTACINIDADYAQRILRAAKVAKRIITFGTSGNPDIKAYNIRTHRGRPCFSVYGEGLEGDFILAMRGLFNVENALAAIAATHAMGIPKECMMMGLAKAKVPGRMEQYGSEDGLVTAIVDYAHNRLSFEKVFESVLTEHQGERIITIFGCPGDKAFNRRRDLGLLAGLYSDKLYLVPDDPGTEAPEEIAREIGRYAEVVGCPYEYRNKRGEAIYEAIAAASAAASAGRKTLILVLGKGNETRQKCGQVVYECLADGEYVSKGLKEYEKIVYQERKVM